MKSSQNPIQPMRRMRRPRSCPTRADSGESANAILGGAVATSAVDVVRRAGPAKATKPRYGDQSGRERESGDLVHRA